MSKSIYTYTFPFSDPDAVTEIWNTAKNHIASSKYAYIMRSLENWRNFIIYVSTRKLEILIPIPLLSEEGSADTGSNVYEIAYFSVEKDKVSTQYESIVVKVSTLSASGTEYEEFVRTQKISGTLALAVELVKADAANIQWRYLQTIHPHGSLIESSSISEQTRMTMHRNDIMRAIGQAIGTHIWSQYSHYLTQHVLTGLTADEKERFRLYLWFDINKSNQYSAQAPNTQYVGVLDGKYILICEELAYKNNDTLSEAIPRYALIPLSTFGGSSHSGIAAAKDLGLDALSAPSVANYMRIRPSLSGTLGAAALNALREAFTLSTPQQS